MTGKVPHRGQPPCHGGFAPMTRKISKIWR